jgi:hypothetical protein
MIQPRLLADFAAVPTPRERREARTHNRAAQGDLFNAMPNDDDHQADAHACDVCASTLHATERCPHGLALSLDMNQEPYS